MDKELAQLEEWAVNLINDYEATLKSGATELKRTRRFSGELVANPEAYGELLDMARSKNMSGKQLVQAIRSIESNLLDEGSRGTSMSRKQLMSDVIHHFYAQRTGGDTLRKLSQANRQQARTALRELFGPWGNVPENLKSLFRAGHLKSDALKGIEGQAAAKLGVTKAGELSLPKAHTTTGKLVTGDVPGATTWQEAVEGMAPQMDIQRTEGLKAIKAVQPLMDQLDVIAGSPYTPTMSAEELAIRRSILSANKDQVIKAFQQFYEPYVIGRGGVNMNAMGIGAITTLISSPEGMAKISQGDINGALETVGLEMIIGEGISQIVQKGLSKVGPQIAGAVAPVLQGASTVSAALTVPEVIARVGTKGKKGAQELQAEAGSAAFAASLGPVSPTLGLSAANAPVDPEMNRQRLELERRSEEARRRGGRISFGVGSVKLTLPEFGLSEMFGIN
jgi:hypothetical protein